MTNPWHGMLDEGEDILWQGRPTQAFAMAKADVIPITFRLIFGAVATAWMAVLALGGSWFWVFGVVHLGVGISLAIYAITRDTVARIYSYYTLTSQCAMSGLCNPWARITLPKFRITPRPKLAPHHEHSVTFGPPGRSKRHPFPTRAPQFTRIDDAGKVYHLMQQIQKGMP